MQKSEKVKSDLDRLKQVYKTWEDFMSKSRIKMKKKIKKDKKEYYDFDYTRGQYYYNYPEYHINFAPPDVQRNFFKDLLERETKPISDVHYSQEAGRFQIEELLRPQELHDFLRDIRDRLQQEITTLRIQKSFYIQENQPKPEVVDFMQDEIRSFNHRLIRVQNIYFTFSKSMSQRLEDRTTTLKLKKFDEMHFSELEKGDFVVYLRMEGAQQRLTFELTRLKNEVELSIMGRKAEILKTCYEKRGAKIKAIEKAQGEKYISRKALIDRYFIDNQPIFFDTQENLKNLQKYLIGLNYTKQMNKSRPFFDVNACLKEVDYIPSNEQELKDILFSVCKNYFPSEMIQNLYHHKKEHLCYRLNYFSSIILRAILESYNFVVQIKEKDLHSLRNTMKRELETIFTNEADKLFNIMQHEIICLIDQGSYASAEFPPISSSQNENIFKEYFTTNRLMDPFTKAILNLLSVTNDKTIKEVIDSYISWIHEIMPLKLKYISLYYKNYHSDSKTHIVNLLNAKLIINAFSDNFFESKFEKILNEGQKIDDGLLRITYLLFAIRNIQLKKELDNIINAEIALMYKIKFKLQLLEYKHHLPFDMTPEFISRFTESNYSHDFTAETERKNSKTYPDLENHDKIFRVKKEFNRQRVEVRRIIPENPLFEGKRVLYRQSMVQSNQIIEKLHNICSYIIEQRENYLHEEKYTGVVDRFQLVNTLLDLEVEYHNKKLRYMEELFQVFELTIHSEGLFLAAEEMYRAKQKEVYFSLDQPHFQEHYRNETQLWSYKADLLAKVRTRQMKYEKDQKRRFQQGIFKNNHVNNLPEISSIYYCDEFVMENEDNIVEEAEDESISEDITESQIMVNSSKYRSDVSGISSEYHVKTTFKQILGRGSINSQQVEQNRREELMGRKKKKLLNDSVLGGILTYQDCSYYRYIHKSLDFMNEIEKMFEQCFDSNDPGLQREFYEEVCLLVSSADEESIKDKNIIDESMLNKLLADCSRAISRVIEKYKVSPSSVDDYYFFSSSIFKSLLENSTFANLNDLRGLYTCLNVVKIHKEYSKYLQSKIFQANVIREFNAVAKRYTDQSFSKDVKYFAFEHLKEMFDLGPFFRMIECPPEQSGSRHLLFLSNYASLTNVALITQQVSSNYYRELLYNFYEEVYDCKSFLVNLELLQTYGVYFDRSVLSITGIQNRLFVRRKIESTNQKIARLLKMKTVQQMVGLPIRCLSLIKKQEKKIPESEANLYENIQMFEDFTYELASAATVITISADKLRLKILEKRMGCKLEKLIKVLPFSNKLIQLKPNSSILYKQIFQQNYKDSFFYDKTLPGTVALEYNRMTIQNLSRILYRDTITDLKDFIKPLLSRRYKQFELNENALEKYYDYMDVIRYQQPYRLRSEFQLKDFFDYHSQFDKNHNVLVWIECKLLLFGASLQSNELLFFRCVLENIVENSPIFFRDESSRLVNYHNIIKMKVDNIETTNVVEKYINSFLNYENLKSKYKSFLDSLGELCIANEGKEIVNVIYLGNKEIFNYCNRVLPDYLQNYCSLKNIKNETNHFVEFTIKTNPNRYLRNHLARSPSFSLFKTFLWNCSNLQAFKKEIFFLEERCEVLKQTLNSNNNKMKDITEQLSLQLYVRERMRESYDFLQIPITKKSRLEYAHFLKKLQEKLLLGIDKLNPTEKYLSKFIEKILKEKPELVGIKDEILQKIYESRFYEQLVLSRLMNISMETLSKDLKLYQILFENYHQKELIRQNKIIKNTLNKILVPKIIINPYLESTLILENYFFAASLKLSYIDSFLNKLKNRAILVELAEGGFGFLLKITELDQCIQSLCKGVITFAQKQFNDRFRTFVESYDELREKYKKSVSQNHALKNMIDICREEWGKEVKSVIYSKMNSYLGTIHTKQKSYESIFNIVKSLELEIAKKIDSQYSTKIHALEEENKRLKEQFIEYQKISARNARSSMQQSKDTLYNSFRREVESILNKDVVKDYAEVGEKEHQEQEEYMSTILLKRLRKQKLFYELKMSSIEAKLREKSSEIIKLKEELTTLDNTLTSEQYKNAKLSEEIKILFEKNIEIEELKREIHKKEEEGILNKFKLIKVNEHIQGKLSRLEDKSRVQTSIIEREYKKEERNIGIQTTVSTQKKERRQFKIRTEHSQQPIQSQNKADELSIWREKWEASERKYHILMSKLVQAYEVYRINKSSTKLVERVAQMFEDCINNQLLRKK